MQSSLETSPSLATVVVPAVELSRSGSRPALAIPPRGIVGFLVTTVAMLLTMHLLGAVATFFFHSPSVFGIVPRFSFNSEANIPAWYAATALFACAALFALIASLKWSARDQYARHWAGLALMFVYMSADEGGQLHELLMEPSQRVLGDGGGWLRFAWTVPAIIIVAGIARAYLGFLVHLPRRYAGLFVLAAALYLGGAIGMEVIGGWYLTNYGDNFQYALMTGFEETLEKIGVVVAIATQLRYLAETYPNIEVTFRRNA